MATTTSTDDGEPWIYQGFPESNTTPIPDEFFDVIAPLLTEAELRVSLYMMRRIRGFKKSEDAISFSQLVGGIKTRDGRVLDQGTGMSKSAVWRGINGLVAKGILTKHTARSPLGDSDTNIYRIHYRGDGGVVLQKNHPSSPKEPPVVLQENTQEADLQETVRHSTDSENSSSIPATPRFTYSEFRTGSRPNFQENRPPVREASPSVPAQPATESSPTRSAPATNTAARGLSSIAEVLGAKGIAKAGGKTRTFPPPAGKAAHAASNYPNTISQAELDAQKAERSSQPGPPPLYIDNVMDDVAEKLIGDLAEAASHRTQARTIWKASGLDVQAFVDILYDARDRVRPRSGVDNKMGYFFKTVRVLTGLDENPNPPADRPQPQGRRRSSSTTGRKAAGEERTSLAGKYAHLVRR